MSVSGEKRVEAGRGAVGRRRRRWSEAQKRQIVAESREHGVSVSVVARRYNVNANQVFAWRRQYCEPEGDAEAGRLVPVDRDSYGRVVAVCGIAGQDLNAWMVAEGWAFACRRYSRAYVAHETRTGGEAGNLARRGGSALELAQGTTSGKRPIGYRTRRSTV